MSPFFPPVHDVLKSQQSVVNLWSGSLICSTKVYIILSQKCSSYDLVFGCIFLACGLFFYSWFGTIMGTDKAPVILHFGPNRARIGYIISGVVFLALGVVGFLLHSR